MKATGPDGKLLDLEECYISTPFKQTPLKMKILPDIGDQKNANYGSEPVIGRSSPITTYSHSEVRTISWTCHFMATEESELYDNMENLRMLEACIYPQTEGQKQTTYRPPPICKIRCGRLLGDEDLCVIMKSYNIKFPTDMVWDDRTYMPYKFDLDLSFEVVYDSADLPGSERIFKSGR